jgi:outer membrane protein assembly factor BamB
MIERGRPIQTLARNQYARVGQAWTEVEVPLSIDIATQFRRRIRVWESPCRVYPLIRVLMHAVMTRFHLSIRLLGGRRPFLTTLACMLLAAGVLARAAGAEDWPTYLHDTARSSTSGETTLSAQNAGQLKKLWSFHTGAGVAAGATVVGGVAYLGSWDGYEYALDASTGALKWQTYLGITNGGSNCPYPQQVGVESTAAVVNGVVYVGGGDNYWYALSASTGAVLWKIDVGNPNGNTYDGHFNWASPLIYNGSAYIGIASLGDCPLVQGKLLRVDLSTHQVVATWKAVPDGQIGGGIWTSPTLDAATNTIYVTTGTQSQSSQTTSAAMVALDGTTLAVKGAWQVPIADQVPDNDWGNTPTLISGGLVAATNKNGVVYAFQRSNISAGPVWQQRIAVGGGCPLCGAAPVSSDAFDGTNLYAGAGQITVNGTTYPGSVTAFNPSNGQVVWRHTLSGIVIPAVAAVNGLVIAGDGSSLVVLDASSGASLFSYATGAVIYGPPTVSGGMIYIGSQDGNLYAFGLGQSNPPPPNTVRVNAGGSGYSDSQGNDWSADTGFSGGMTYSDGSSVAGTSDPALYQSLRWNRGSFGYTFTGLAAGSYQVTLKFAEIAGLGPGKRQFNVAIQGTQVLTNFDVSGSVGLDTALDKTFTATVGSNGTLTIDFSQGAANNPIINAIQIVPG